MGGLRRQLLCRGVGQQQRAARIHQHQRVGNAFDYRRQHGVLAQQAVQGVQVLHGDAHLLADYSAAEFAELERRLGDPATHSDVILARRIGRRYAELTPIGKGLAAYDRVIVPEMNLGQLAMVLRAKYLVPVESYSRVRGLPISLSELARDLTGIIDEEATK